MIPGKRHLIFFGFIVMIDVFMSNERFQYSGSKIPFELHLDHPKTTIRANIDPKLEPHDKLSQVHFTNVLVHLFC